MVQTYSGIVPAQLSPTNKLLTLSGTAQTFVLSVYKLLQWHGEYSSFPYKLFDFIPATASTRASVQWIASALNSVTGYITSIASLDPTGENYAEVIQYFLDFNLATYSTTTSKFSGTSQYDPLSAVLPYQAPAYTDVYIGHYTKFKGKTVDFGGCALSSIADPVNAQDVASKKYIDDKVSPLATASSVVSALTNAKSYTDSAVSTASTTLNASIANVQTQVSNILVGADTTSDTLAKVASLAQSLDSAETASLSSAVASLQGQINTKTTDITALQTLTAGYATEIDTAKIKQAYIDIEESGPFNNSIKTDPATGNLVLSTPTANGSCVVNIPTNWFLTDTIGATSYSSVQFNNAIDMGGYYNQPKKIIHLADASDPADAMAYHQFTEYKSSNDSALATIASNLALEASRADTVENNLSSSISTESTRAQDAESDLQTAIDSLSTSLTSLSTKEEDDITAIKAKASADIALLQSKIDTLQAQLTVQSGYITQVYKYIWDTAPSVVPNR
jgi:hypothetical protein